MIPELRNYMYHPYENGYISYPIYVSHMGYGHPSNYPHYHPHIVSHIHLHVHPHIHLANYSGKLQFAVPIQAPVQ